MIARPATLIHVGLHKTGTTWLQRNLFERRHGHEIEYFGDIRVIYGRLITPSAHEFSADAARESFAPTLEKAAAADRLAVISGEALAGRPFHQKYFREVTADRLAAAFPDAHILITIREQRAIILSMYGQYVRFGYSASLEDFMAMPPPDTGFHSILDFEFYDYEKLIACYQNRFAPDRVSVLPFEWMLADPAAALAALSARVGRTLPLPEGRGERVVNPAWSDLAFEATRQLNRTVAQDARWRRRPWIAPNAMGRRVDALTPAFLRRAMRAKRVAQVRAAVGDRYAASNARVAARIGVDLATHGYQTAAHSTGD